MTFLAPFRAPFQKPFPQEGGAAAFSPTDIAGLLGYDFSDISTLYQDSGATTPVTSDGDVIGYAADISITGNNITQSVTASKAIYKTGIQNGLSIARVDGNDKYNFDSYLFLDDFTIFWASNLTNLGVGLIGYTGTPGASIRIKNTGTLTFKVSVDVDLTTTGAFSTGTWHVGAVRRNSNSFTAYKNGVDITNGTPSSSSQFQIENLFYAQSFADWQGDTGFVYIVPSALSDGDMTNMWNYINTKWAVY